MSRKRYNRKCEVCNDPFVAKKSDARFCSGKCRARYSRENKDSSYQKTIQLQSKALSKVLVPEVGDLTELKEARKKFQDSIVIEPGKYKCQDCGKSFKPEHRRQEIDENGDVIWVKHKNYAGHQMVMYCWDCVVKQNSKPDMFGRKMCVNCGRWYIPDHADTYCLPGMGHRFKR